MRLPTLCVLALAPLTWIAQPSSNAKVKAATHADKAASVIYTAKPFDSSVQTLPVHFRGNNLQLIWLTLTKRQTAFAKSGYETEQQFQERLKKLSSESVNATIKMDDSLAFVIPIECAEYDAEGQKLPFYIPYNKSYLSNGGLVTWDWSSSYVNGKSYVASNAFGASAKIDTVAITNYTVAADLPQWLDKQSFSQLDTKSSQAL